jgi:phosphotriesterase-related protein
MGGEDLILEDMDKSVEEVELFKQAGGESVIDCTTTEYGRDAAALADVSRRSGVHIIASTGHIMEGYWRGVEDIAGRTEDSLIEEMVTDLTKGIPGAGGVRSGVIKVGSSRDEVKPEEEKMLRCAVEVQKRTGAPIQTHTTAGTAPLEQVRIFADAGADPEHTMIGHLDRRLAWDDHKAIAEAGYRLGFDCISKEHYQPEAKRIEFVERLIGEGHGGQVMLSGDIARRSYMTAYGGGPGYTYILWRFIPWLHK